MSCSSLIVVGFSHLLTVLHYDDSIVEREKELKEGPTLGDLTISNREVMTLNEEISWWPDSLRFIYNSMIKNELTLTPAQMK